MDEYILAQDENVREYLQRIRSALKSALPDTVEKISWSMPTYWNGHNIIHFAASKKHIGLYPGPEAVAHFAEKLDRAGCMTSKGDDTDSLVRASSFGVNCGDRSLVPGYREPCMSVPFDADD